MTMTTKTYTKDEFTQLLRDEEYTPENVAMINRWLARGDGAAVYENVDLGHRHLGHKQITSYGSPAAMLEVDTPPERLPDIGNSINYRYYLAGTYKGEEVAL